MFWQTTLRILCELHKKKSTETRLVAKLGLSRHCCNKGESIEHGSGDESEPTNCIQSSLALSMALSIKQLQTRMPNQQIGVMITNRIRSIGRSVIRRFSNDLEIGIFSSKFRANENLGARWSEMNRHNWRHASYRRSASVPQAKTWSFISGGLRLWAFETARVATLYRSAEKNLLCAQCGSSYSHRESTVTPKANYRISRNNPSDFHIPETH